MFAAKRSNRCYNWLVKWELPHSLLRQIAAGCLQHTVLLELGDRIVKLAPHHHVILGAVAGAVRSAFGLLCLFVSLFNFKQRPAGDVVQRGVRPEAVWLVDVVELVQRTCGDVKTEIVQFKPSLSVTHTMY